MPLNNFVNSGSWVATPTEQVFRWHFLSIIHPITINPAVAIPHSSAPNKVAIATSRPVFICPSVCTTILPLSPFDTRTWFVSASPNSHGNPACLIEPRGAAPVPPLIPEINTTSPFAFATPAAIIPTPASETNFTCIRACLFIFFKSCISWAKSSIE